MEYKLTQPNKKNKWRIKWYDPETKKTCEASTGCSQKLEAEQFLEAFKQAHKPRNTVTVGDCLDMYCDYLMRKQNFKNRPRTKSTRKMLKFFDNSNPYDLEKDQMLFENFRLKKGVSQSTIARELSVLSSALTFACSKKGNRILDRLPATIEFDNPKNKRLRWLDQSEEERLFNALKDEPDYVRLTIGLALTTAQRLGAILELTKESIHLEEKLINFKHGLNPEEKRKGRSWCVIDDSVSLLLKKAIVKSKSGFIIEKNGKPILNIYEEFKRVLNKAEIKDFTFHDLRTTWATRSLMSKVPMIEISNQLAHSSIKITEEHYAKLPFNFRPNANKFTKKQYKGKSF